MCLLIFFKHLGVEFSKSKNSHVFFPIIKTKMGKVKVTKAVNSKKCVLFMQDGESSQPQL